MTSLDRDQAYYCQSEANLLCRERFCYVKDFIRLHLRLLMEFDPSFHYCVASTIVAAELFFQCRLVYQDCC